MGEKSFNFNRFRAVPHAIFTALSKPGLEHSAAVEIIYQNITRRSCGASHFHASNSAVASSLVLKRG